MSERRFIDTKEKITRMQYSSKLTMEDVERLRAQWDRMHTGRDAARRTKILEEETDNE